jgi:hypothetical protein
MKVDASLPLRRLGLGGLLLAACQAPLPPTAGPEAMTFALLVATPARRLSWPRVRVTRPKASWRGRLTSNASA